MDKTIQTLLNGYELPAVLSSAEDGGIVFLNNAARHKLDLSDKQIAKTKLYDLFSSRRVIRQNVIWERDKKEFEINEEKLVIEGKTYIRSIIKPIEDSGAIDLVDMQKEMAELLVHRFHSPLNGITGFTELLKELDLTEKQSRYVKEIESGLDDFKQILSNIRDLAEDIDVQYSTIDIQKFAQKLLSQYSPEQKKRIKLTIDPNLIKVKSDFVLLSTIITELLDNALEFSSDTLQKIQLHFREDHIIRLTSFGTKIPDSFAKKMFYPFFTNKARGIGLGLSKCVYFAQKLGYEIRLTENSSVEGISFDIRMR